MRGERICEVSTDRTGYSGFGLRAAGTLIGCTLPISLRFGIIAPVGIVARRGARFRFEVRGARVIRFNCPNCGRHYELPDALASLPLVCKQCGQRMTPPAPSPEPPPPPKPVAPPPPA